MLNETIDPLDVLLNDLDQLREKYSKSIIPEQFLSSMIYYATTLSLMNATNKDVAIFIVNKSVNAAKGDYKKIKKG